MFLLLTIIAGVVGAVLGRRAGFVTVWIFLFNLLIAIYISLMLSPTLIGYVPLLDSSSYYRALTLLFVVLLTFLMCHNFVGMFLAQSFSATVPRFFNNFFAAVTGFVTGHFACGFILFIIGVTPVAEISFMNQLSETSLAQAVEPPVLCSTQIVSTISFQCDRRERRQVIEWLTTGRVSKEKDITSDHPAAVPDEPDT
ncbi:MAG: CvpA family protein [Sedimentisphaerales bacterium]|nr:CvpA family protein [Sedimentisphaerales bacterium]